MNSSSSILTEKNTPVYIRHLPSNTTSLYSYFWKKERLEIEVIQGQDTGSFYKTKRLGGLALPINPYYKYEQLASADSSMSSVTPDGVNRVESENVWVFNEYLWPTQDGCIGAASDYDFASLNQKAAAKHTPDFDLLTFAATFSQTRELFNRATYKTAARMADPQAWRQIKRKPGQMLGALADSWLITRYGWGPAIMDLNAIIAIIKDKAGATQVLQRAMATDNDTTTTSITRTYEDSAVRLDFTRTDAYSVSRRSVVAALYRFEKGVAKINPLQTAWELIPYSFVVDWFVNVGNIIDSMSVVLGASEIKVSNGTLVVCSSTGQMTTTSKNGYQRGDKLATNSMAMLKTRIPGALTLTPTLKPRITKLRLADSAALIYKAAEGFLKKRKR